MGTLEEGQTTGVGECEAMTRRGRRCEVPAQVNRRWCHVHDPAGVFQRQRSAHVGGRALAGGSGPRHAAQGGTDERSEPAGRVHAGTPAARGRTRQTNQGPKEEA